MLLFVVCRGFVFSPHFVLLHNYIAEKERAGAFVAFKYVSLFVLNVSSSQCHRLVCDL